MSLAHHVTAIEGVDREDPQIDDELASEPRWRRLSFDAFAPIDHSAFPEAEPVPYVAAYNISPARRIGKPPRNHLHCLVCYCAAKIMDLANLTLQPRSLSPLPCAVWHQASSSDSRP